MELPRLYLAWHSPALFADGDAELDLVGEVLSSGKTSRLYRSLVYEQRIATEVAASQNSRELGSFFQIVATAAPGRTLAEVERAIAKEIAGLIDRGPTPAELERCLAQAEAHFLFRLQTVGGFGGKSDQLNAYNTFLGDPGYFERDLERYRVGHGRRSCSAAAAQWLEPDSARRAQRRPARPCRRWRSPDSQPVDGVLMGADRSRLPALGPERPFTFPAIRRTTLANGLRVWTVEHRQVPLVSVLALLPVGASSDPPDRPGLAAITGDMLDEGCGDRSALDVHEALGRIGAQLDIDVGHDATVLGLTTLERYLGAGPRAGARHADPARGSSSASSIASAICG